MLRQFDKKFRRGVPSQDTASHPAVPASAENGYAVAYASAVSCDYVAENASSYVDAELNPLAIQQIANHLNHCPNCAKMVADVERVGLVLEREWCDSALLPSSLEVEFALDSILDALPPVHESNLESKHTGIPHVTRWVRFTTGVVGGAIFVTSLWSSYQIGFWQGRASAFTPEPAVRQPLSPAPTPPKTPPPTLLQFRLPLKPPRVGSTT